MTSNTPSNPPSSRPMTLRQQLLDIDKLRQTHQIDNPEYIDRLVEVCQEIAREARRDQVMQDFLMAVMVLEDDEKDLIEWRDACLSELTQKPPQPNEESAR